MDEGLTAADLRVVLRYEAESGAFFWLAPLSPRARVGSRAGTVNAKGYRVIKLMGSRYRAHRLAWLYMYGVWPSADIDHINGTRDDNRIANLRDVTNQVNSMNRIRAKGQSGLVGVSRRGVRWAAEIYRNGEKHYLGQFATPEAARLAYEKAKSSLHPEVATLEAH